jgi:hypothetical protein
MESSRGGKPNAQYNVAAPDSLAIRVTARMRRRMYDRFVAVARPAEHESVLDVGVTSDRSYASSNYLEAWYPAKHRLTACGLDDASFLEEQYPGLRFVPADGLALPFEGRLLRRSAFQRRDRACRQSSQPVAFHRRVAPRERAARLPDDAESLVSD